MGAVMSSHLVLLGSNSCPQALRSMVMCALNEPDGNPSQNPLKQAWLACLFDCGWNTYAVAPHCLIHHSMPMPIAM
jgi:hypothetical protein